MSKPYTQILNAVDRNRWNCVLYARSRYKKLPFGLWTISDKKKIINCHTPETNIVAIMSCGLPWGHVGIVTKVGKQHLTIQEANYKAGKITERHGTTADLKIIGYYK